MMVHGKGDGWQGRIRQPWNLERICLSTEWTPLPLFYKNPLPPFSHQSQESTILPVLWIYSCIRGGTGYEKNMALLIITRSLGAKEEWTKMDERTNGGPRRFLE